jgi:hypothetical protein
LNIFLGIIIHPQQIPPHLNNSSEETHKEFRIFPLAMIVAPVVLTWKLWAAIWTGEQSRAWDGTGHYAIAQFYDQTIFPNTIGWTDAYFAGMPFPNFYPPVFYWSVALLHHTHLFSFNTAFKLAVTIPVLLMPAAIWWLGWRLSNRSRLVATAASLASVILLVDLRFMGSLLAGLDYFSTFQIGLYTQPLGFVLMIAWYVVYADCGGLDAALDSQNVSTKNLEKTTSAKTLSLALSQGEREGNPIRRTPNYALRFALCAVLLALTVLSNFFNAVTASVFIATTIISDVLSYRRMTRPSRAGKRDDSTERQSLSALARDAAIKTRNSEREDKHQRAIARQILSLHLFSPMVVALLAAFWLVPMITEYKYFVTRPYAPETQSLLSPWLLAWFLVALIGAVLWWRGDQKRRQGAALQSWPYLAACAILALAVVFAAVFAPSWFPLQTPRFLATLTFLLTVPVGLALASAFLWFARLLGEISSKNPTISLKRTTFTLGTAALIFTVLVMSAPNLSWAYAFYPRGQKTSIEELLEFARQHRDGRYLVEVINPKVGPAWTEASFDARAINSYLGSQGNETISGVFHEASPNALFTLPVVNAFSNYPDSFGVSSVLADDLDFAAQPWSEQIKRAQFLGVKYLVIRTPAMKERISKEVSSVIRHDIGWWAVFELPGPTTPKIQALSYKPALVLSSFTVKARRRNELSFIRLAEEQFNDNWFDVLLVRSDESQIDRLNELDKFAALIIDKYDYSDETAAFERLRKFSQDHALICLSADNGLFRRIQQARADFPKIEIIYRQPEEAGETVEALKPSYHYNSSSIRQLWKQLRSILEKNKIPSYASSSDFSDEANQDKIKVVSKTERTHSTPILIASTFHPNWERSDGSSIYAATPFFMVTFVEQSAVIEHGRTRLDRVALWISAGTLVALGVFVSLRFRRLLG